MTNLWKTGSRLGILTASLALGTCLIASPSPKSGQQTDNTKTNQGDGSTGATTAQQQSNNPADRDTTKQIRAAIMKDKSLSIYAHNVKVITQNGKVTLKGPVRSDDEKRTVEATATSIAGADNVTNQLTIVRPKQ